MHRTLAFLIIILCLYVSQISSTPYLNQNSMMKLETFCGKKLSNTLSLICNGIYNTPVSKKNVRDISAYGNQYEEGITYDDLFPFWAIPNMDIYMTNRKVRKGSGVIYECCHQPCSRETLAKYCGTISK